MESSIARGELIHSRFHPVNNTFKSTHTMLLINQADLAATGDFGWKFPSNKFWFLSIKNHNYMDKSTTSIKQKVEDFLSQKSSQLTKYDKVYLLTTPSVFGYGFNPVIFYIVVNSCHDIKSVIAEVNNTFSESHLYYLDEVQLDQSQGNYWSSKQLHVSPFLERVGEYEFNFHLSTDDLKITITLHQRSEKMITTLFDAKLVKMTSFNLWKICPSIMKTVLFTEINILKHAYKLFHHLKVPFYSKPDKHIDNLESPSRGFIHRLRIPYKRE